MSRIFFSPTITVIFFNPLPKSKKAQASVVSISWLTCEQMTQEGTDKETLSDKEEHKTMPTSIIQLIKISSW